MRNANAVQAGGRTGGRAAGRGEDRVGAQPSMRTAGARRTADRSQERAFTRSSFLQRLGTMLAVDLRRMFSGSLLYIMLGISVVTPVLVLCMTSMFGGEAGSTAASNIAAANGTSGTDAAASMTALFTNVWQAIGSTSAAGMSIDLTTMCNMNLVYFMVAVLACLFVCADFSSGFAKNLFAVRAKPGEYAVSKILVCWAAGAIMLAAFFIGALLGGRLAGLSFAMEGFGPFNLVCCLLAKVLLMGVFVGIYVVCATFAKRRAWLALCLAFTVGMFMFMVISLVTPLDANPMHVLLCAAGAALFAAGLAKVGGQLLQSRDIL